MYHYQCRKFTKEQIRVSKRQQNKRKTPGDVVYVKLAKQNRDKKWQLSDRKQYLDREQVREGTEFKRILVKLTDITADFRTHIKNTQNTKAEIEKGIGAISDQVAMRTI